MGYTWIMKTLLLLLALMAAFPAWCDAPPPVEVVLEGVDGPVRENIASHLTLLRNSARLTPARVRLWFQRAPEEIRQALMPLGHYHPTIASRLDGVTAPWRAVFRIDPGPPTLWGAVVVTLVGEAARDPAFAPWQRALDGLTGTPFRHEGYENAKKELLRLAAERGYLEGQLLAHRVEVDTETRQAQLTLHYDSGPRHRFGALAFTRESLDAELLQRYLPFRRGDPYDTQGLLQLQQGLRGAGYFRVVEVAPGKPVAGEVPVAVTLELLPANEYTVGLGYGTDTGPRATLGWERRWLNLRGHQTELLGKVSEISRKLTARYVIPWDDPTREKLTLSMDLEREFATDTGDSRQLSWGASLLRQRGAWRETLELEYQLEDFAIGDEAGKSELLMPGVTWLHSEGDHPLRPREGHRFLVNARGAVETLFADATFVQAWGQGKAIRPLGVEGRVLVTGEVGATATSDFDDLPTSVRFFAGGSNRVRGYDYNSLGPKDDDGDVVGGQYLLAGGLEYERTLWEPWSGAVFVDAGNAFNAVTEPFHVGVGIGVRWQSPLGPVRVDLAYPLDEEGEEGGEEGGEGGGFPFRLHLNFGPEL